MKYQILITIFTILCFNGNASELKDFIFPSPKTINIQNGYLNRINGSQFPNDSFISLAESFNQINICGEIKDISSPIFLNALKLKIDSGLIHDQQYILKIDSTTITITGKNETALYYGKQTLSQIIRYSRATKNPIPCIIINDWPDFVRRGYMLDISRDKVPTMQTLFQMVDLLASWKINEFQLYTEHTFAYKNHKVVWENYSPMTAEEIKQLDLYCKNRFVDLVPNQNSFGHMENWLKHDEYLNLAECPTDCETIWGKRSRTSLNPTNPGSFMLMQELYNELLPNFTSQYFNIGCDETVELGCGLSKQLCDKIGKGKVYLEYLKKLNTEVNSHNKTTQFWGDIILNHTELIDSLPKNMIALVWGYESTYPFQEKLLKFKEAGLDFYVCPGTSTWRSIIGRNHDAFINLKQAAVNGKKYGAKGYLNTNWGDHGHWQPLSVCYPAMAVGSSYSWNSESFPEKQVENILNEYVFEDKSGNTGKAVMLLGNAYLACDIPEGNANAFHLMLSRYKWTMEGQFQTKMLKTKNLLAAEKEISISENILKSANPTCNDSTLVIKELNQAILLAKHGIHLGIARLNAPKHDTKNIDSNTKTALINELSKIMENHKKIWVLRNRIGGLNSSLEKMNNLLNYYNQ